VTTPKQARETDSGRYYADPNPAFDGALYPSVTNILGTAINKPVLVPWSAKITAEYAMDNLPRLVKASRDPKTRDEMLKEVKAQVRFAREDAADLGSRVHASADAHNLGLPMDPDPDVARFTRQYLAWLAEWGVDIARDVEASEASVVHRDAGYAGTFDLLVWLRSGLKRERELWLIDFKTSSTRGAESVYEDHVLQLAALRFAKTVWLRSGLEEPMPAAHRTAVLNLRKTTYALMEVPADRAAFGAFQGALSLTKYLHALDLKTAAARVSPGGAVAPVKALPSAPVLTHRSRKEAA
jgi:hypothetical protein